MEEGMIDTSVYHLERYTVTRLVSLVSGRTSDTRKLNIALRRAVVAEIERRIKQALATAKILMVRGT